MKKNIICLMASTAMILTAMGGVTAMAEEAAPGSVEIMSWWTGGGEAEALNAIVEVFRNRMKA